MNIIFHKFKDIIFSILPIIILVFILNFTLIPIETSLIIKFLIGAGLIIIGLTIFLLGVDIGISPIGNNVGEKLAQSNSLIFILISGFVLGFFISLAEPDLHVIASQIELFSAGAILKSVLIITVSLGIGIAFCYGIYRIVNNISLRLTMLILYLIIFVLMYFSPRELIAVAFDTSGATTGALAVPFVLAITIGIAKIKKSNQDSNKDSFGLIGIISAGALIAGLILNFYIRPFIPIPNLDNIVTPYYDFLSTLLIVTKEVGLSLTPIIITFLILNKFILKIDGRKLSQIYKGIFYAFLGMVLFLVGVNTGFLEIGRFIGTNLANEHTILLAFICFLLGITSILAEPAVYVLTKQIEEVTSGYIKRRFVLIFLALGVGLALTIAFLKIKFNIDIVYILVVGYTIAIILSYLVPKIFVGMAFDSGGVTSGPMTVTFILAFFHGIANNISDNNLIVDGFGIIALVVLMPIITLQLLGLIYKVKTVKGGI